MIEEDSVDSIFDLTAPTQNVIERAEEGPDILSAEWHDYAMGKFLDSELVEINGDKYPNCYGLRRVAELLIGTIIESKPIQVFMSPDSTTNTPGQPRPAPPAALTRCCPRRR